MPQETMVTMCLPSLLLPMIIPIVVAFVTLYKKGKTVEAMLVVNAFLQFITILLLIFLIAPALGAL